MSLLITRGALPSKLSLVETQVLGAPAASVTLTPVSPATEDIYIIKTRLEATAAASEDGIRIFFNADTTTNHYNNFLFVCGLGLGVAGIGSNDCYCGNLPQTTATEGGMLDIECWIDATNHIQYFATSSSSTTANPFIRFTNGVKSNAQHTTITGITLNCPAGNFGTGSEFTLYKITRS